MKSLYMFTVHSEDMLNIFISIYNEHIQHIHSIYVSAYKYTLNMFSVHSAYMLNTASIYV